MRGEEEKNIRNDKTTIQHWCSETATYCFYLIALDCLHTKYGQPCWLGEMHAQAQIVHVIMFMAEIHFGMNIFWVNLNALLLSL